MKDDRLYLIHISECIVRIKSYVTGSGFRNVLVHDYLGVDLDRAWLIVERELPRLKQTIEAMQRELP